MWRRRTGVTLIAGTVATSALAGCTSDARPESPPRTPANGQPPAAPAKPGSPRTLASGLEVPWAIAFLPGGDALVTERDSARLLRVSTGGRVTKIATIASVEAQGEAGLLGVAVSPRFSTDRHVFVYHTAARDNRIVRFSYDDRRGRLTGRKVIVSGIPTNFFHDGGRLAFGPDGYLYATTGEAGRAPLAQDRTSLGGKILRMTQDGKPAPGNPFGSLVWTYGHRNVQGVAWDAGGRMFATEFGASDFDEVNRVQAGRNYGWPEVEGVGGAKAKRRRFTDPLLTWRPAKASPSGLAFAGGSLWAAALRGERLWQIPVNSDGSVRRPRAHYIGKYGRLRAVATAPDGSLWITTSNRDGRGDPRKADDRILVVPLR